MRKAEDVWLADGSGEPLDRLAELGEHGLAVFLRGVEDAAADVVFEDEETGGTGGSDDGGELGQNVEAVLVLLDHPLDAPHLALHPAQARQDLRLVGSVGGRVAVAVVAVRVWRGLGCGLRRLAHAGDNTLSGYKVQ